MYFPRLTRAAAVVAMAVAMCSTAKATLTTYSDRTTFLAALPGAAESESFEDEATDVALGPRIITTSTSDIEFTGNGSATFGVSDLVTEACRAWGGEVIVLGTHGRRGFSRALLGSDAELIVRYAEVPVLLVRGPKVD